MRVGQHDEWASQRQKEDTEHPNTLPSKYLQFSTVSASQTGRARQHNPPSGAKRRTGCCIEGAAVLAKQSQIGELCCRDQSVLQRGRSSPEMGLAWAWLLLVVHLNSFEGVCWGSLSTRTGRGRLKRRGVSSKHDVDLGWSETSSSQRPMNRV